MAYTNTVYYCLFIDSHKYSHIHTHIHVGQDFVHSTFVSFTLNIFVMFSVRFWQPFLCRDFFSRYCMVFQYQLVSMDFIYLFLFFLLFFRFFSKALDARKLKRQLADCEEHKCNSLYILQLYRDIEIREYRRVLIPSNCAMKQKNFSVRQGNVLFGRVWRTGIG